LVTYAVVDALTGSMLSSHGSYDAARAELAHAAREAVSIYVFDDTGHVAGECSTIPSSSSSTKNAFA
jgi:hypothetical protein